MDAKIDYLSFTLPINAGGVGHSDELYTEIQWQFEQRGLFGLQGLLSVDKPTRNGKRKIYGTGLRWEANNVNLWWGGEDGIANHVLCEISGVGCQLLRDEGAMLPTVQGVADRATRLDIAIDIEDSPPTPREFVTLKAQNRFPITQQNDTQTGLTQYAGSRESERYARVYVYLPPHPRAGVLRVEHVMRSKYAKQAVLYLLANGMPSIVSTLGNTFGWEHPRWKPAIVTEGKLRVTRADKSDAGTLRWAIKAVAPALAKMHRNGLIDLDVFVERYVRPLIDPPNSLDE